MVAVGVAVDGGEVILLSLAPTSGLPRSHRGGRDGEPTLICSRRWALRRPRGRPAHDGCWSMHACAPRAGRSRWKRMATTRGSGAVMGSMSSQPPGQAGPHRDDGWPQRPRWAVGAGFP